MTEKLPQHAVLVPVDFSPSSEAAMDYAIMLADSLEAPLVVLHVVHDPGDEPGFYARALKKKQIQKMEDIGRDLLSDFLHDMAKRYPDSKAIKSAVPTLLVGLPVTKILALVEQTQPRMVVMGSRGLSGLSHILVGSVAERVVHLCPVPITIVKESKESKELKKELKKK